ncbi:MAG: excalibur calcium-binding domain-containing protein [Cyanobacteria bacterium P01_C01_bin.38]
MNKILLFTLLALSITACETSTSSKTTESSQIQEPVAEITPVSRIVPEVSPSSIPTLKAVPEPDIVKPLPSATLQAAPTANPIAKSADKPINSSQEVKQLAKSTNNAEKPVNLDKLVANISSKIGCGEIDQKYKIRVATIAIANYNRTSLQGLSRKQIRQAVKKSIADYPERAEGLVQEYRSQYCTVAKNPTSENPIAVDNKQQVSATTSEIIPRQSGTCKELRARGIKNINVAANPWAKRKDRDNDGIACESE